MKGRFLLLALAVFVGFAANAQIKVGYVNVDYVLSQMPEAKQIQAELGAYEKQLTNQLQNMGKEFQTKMADLQQNGGNMTELVLADKQQELQALQQRIQQFQMNAEQKIQEKQVTLLQPAYDKIQATIDLVAEEKGYTYIFNSRPGGLAVLLHAPEGDDISVEVLKKMGVTVTE